ncbi:MAG: folate-binding protein YgfZ [Halioglobus sp.]|nr:folate-binding protein YgfZ [Halioglobus sp.]
MSCYYTTLGREALLHIQGPDARTFLQGQVTCDTRKLSASAALPGSYCTAQGRVVCDFLLCALAEDHLILRMRREIRAHSAAVLARYIVFSKAQLQAEREDWQVVACWGADAAGTLQQLFGAIPSTRYGASRGQGFCIVQLDKEGSQFECYLEQTSAAALARRLEQAVQAGAEQQWQALQIASGIARIEAGTSDQFVPQMLNYDVTGHISFNKGCYTGQEVVARLHYKGTPKRRLYLAGIARADITGQPQVTAGDPLFCSNNSQAVGNVINCVATPEGALQLLVTSTRDGIEAGLRLFATDGPLLQTAPVPYPIAEK